MFRNLTKLIDSQHQNVLNLIHNIGQMQGPASKMLSSLQESHQTSIHQSSKYKSKQSDAESVSSDKLEQSEPK